MTTARLGSLVRIAYSAVAGLSFGFAVAGIGEAPFHRAVLLMAAAFGAEWVKIRFGPLGGITLRPVVAFLGLWSAGPSTYLLVGLVPGMLMGLFGREQLYQQVRERLPDVLGTAGRDAVALWAAYLVFVNLRVFSYGELDSVAPFVVLAMSFVAYWIVSLPAQALELSQREGVRYSVGVRHLAHHAWRHTVVLTCVTVFFSHVAIDLGFIVMLLAVVAMIAPYYPWKLLGDQGGVLITSLQVMAQAVDLKDPYTSNHSQRVADYATRIARAMALSEDDVNRVRIGGLMHDIGKIGISGRIIRKPGKLTPEEKALMNRHSSVSADIIEHLEILGESADIVRHHHEHCDGSGYPDGLKGEEIPLGSRIILVADAFDALTTDRPYRGGASRERAIAIIRESAGTQFDPAVVAALERVLATL